jgi:hypothetical protein
MAAEDAMSGLQAITERTPRALGLLAMMVLSPTLVSCGGSTIDSADRSGASAARLAGGRFGVSTQRWQKDAYRDVAGITPGWPQHTTIAVSVVDLDTGETTVVWESDCHGSSLASHLVEQSAAPVSCLQSFGDRAGATAFAQQICACTCDSMGPGATTFLSDNLQSDLRGVQTFVNQVDHATLNGELACGPGAGADPTQRISDDLTASPRNYRDIGNMISSQCSPEWSQATETLMGTAWGSYHVCNNDAALEEWTCSAGACPNWNSDSTLIRSLCDGPRIMGP